MTPDEIRNLRTSLGWSQERLANELGVSWATVQRWEKGKTEPSPLAEARLRELFDRIERERKERTMKEYTRTINDNCDKCGAQGPCKVYKIADAQNVVGDGPHYVALCSDCDRLDSSEDEDIDSEA